MSIARIQSLNENLANKRITMPYPHAKIIDVSDALALIVPSLEKGDLPVLCEHEGTLRKVGSIRNSALVLRQLSRITRVMYVKSEDVSVDVSNTDELLKVI